MCIEIVDELSVSMEKFSIFKCPRRNVSHCIFSPTMCSGSNDNALRARCCSARNRKRQDAEIEVDVLPLYAHATAEVLLQNIPICLKIRSWQIHSSTSHPMTRPSNYKSLMVSVPVQLEDVTNWFFMSSVHSYFQTQYFAPSSPGVMTPTAPSLQTYVYWM